MIRNFSAATVATRPLKITIYRLKNCLQSTSNDIQLWCENTVAVTIKQAGNNKFNSEIN